MQKKRLSVAVVSGIAVDALNKLVPLIIIWFVQKKMGPKSFGYSQFGISILEMAIPFIVFGYNNYGIVRLGQLIDDRQASRSLFSQITYLKLTHLLLTFAGLTAFVAWSPDYREYLPVVLSSGFVLVFSSIEGSWVQVATQQMTLWSVITAVSRFVSLVFVLLLVDGPEDSVLFVALYFIGNGLISLFSGLYAFKRFPLVKPDPALLKEIFQGSKRFAFIVVAVVLLDRVDMVVVERLQGDVGAGLYGGAMRLNNALVQILVTIQTIFLSEMVVLRDPESLTKHLRAGFLLMLTVLMPVVVGLMFVSEDILSLIFDDSFRQAALALKLMTVSGLATVALGVFGTQILMIRGEELWYALGLGLGVVAVFVLATLFGRELGLGGVALGLLLGKALAAGFVVARAKKHLSAFPWKELGRGTIPAGIMGLVLLVLPKMNLIYTVLTAVPVYCVAVYWVNREIFGQILLAVKKRRRGSV